MSDDVPEPPDAQDKAPENVVPFDTTLSDAFGEISDESLRQFNEMMESSPGEDAGEEEIAAFMSKVMESEAGSKMIESFSDQLKEGGLLDGLLADDDAEAGAVYSPPESSVRFIYRVNLSGTKPLVWRRFSLPSDASFFDLHCAIQDSFGWEGKQLHQFELRSHGRIESTFSSGPGGWDHETAFCEIETRVEDVSRDGWPSFHYLYDFIDRWEHLVSIEKVVGAGREGTSLGLAPMMHDGEGLCPPEDCGGLKGFAGLLSGDGDHVPDYPADFLEKLREGEFHPPAVRFRDAATVLREQELF